MISFAETYPELLSEWSEENRFMPEEISYGSNKMVIWNGSCGHVWEATAKNRGRGSGCPYCSGNKVLQGFNDLATSYPDIADEWSDRNYPMVPGDVTAKANKKAWWKCKRCGYEWTARIADRTDKHGCPVCAGERLVGGINDFETEHPCLAAEWSDRNEKKPSLVWSKSRENVWWRCTACGHEWMAVVNSRVKGSGCPECKKRLRHDLIPYHNKEEERIFRKAIIAYYAAKSGTRVLMDNDGIIGIRMDAYFPEQKAAIIYSRPVLRKCLVRRERAVNWLCFNSGIKLIRIMPNIAKEYDNCICITLTDRSFEVLSLALQTAFDMAEIDTGVDIERDMKEILGFRDTRFRDTNQNVSCTSANPMTLPGI